MKKTIIAAICAATMSLTANAAAFTDVKSTDWFSPSVEYAVSNGLFNGTSSTEFSPKASMTRGMFVTVLGRLAKIDEAAYNGSAFDDVQISAYYAPYVKWASSKGIVSGTGGGKFSPNAPVTREQLAKMFYTYAASIGVDTDEVFTPDKYYDFTDYLSVSRYAANAMSWCVNTGVINGADGKLNPKGTATRAEVATMLMNAQDALKANSGSNTGDQNGSNSSDSNTGTDTTPDTDKDNSGATNTPNTDFVPDHNIGVDTMTETEAKTMFESWNAIFKDSQKYGAAHTNSIVNMAINLQKVPDYIRKLFVAQNRQMFVSLENLDHDGKSVAGLFDGTNIYIKPGFSTSPQTAVHEVGHFVQSRWETAAINKICEAAGREYLSVDELDSVHNQVDMQDEFSAEADTLATLSKSTYCKTNANEFFAVAFAHYISQTEVSRDQLKENCPLTYAAIENAIADVIQYIPIGS